MQFIGCLLSLLLVGFFIVLSFGISIVRVVMRMLGFDVFGPKRNAPDVQTPKEPQRQQVFKDDEGEYVDFEEV